MGFPCPHSDTPPPPPHTPPMPYDSFDNNPRQYMHAQSKLSAKFFIDSTILYRLNYSSISRCTPKGSSRTVVGRRGGTSELVTDMKFARNSLPLNLSPFSSNPFACPYLLRNLIIYKNVPKIRHFHANKINNYLNGIIIFRVRIDR